MGTMSKRERLQAAIAGQAVDRCPVALWQHFPGDDRTPHGLAAATLSFQRAHDFDFVKVTPSSSFCLQDWGARDVWQGSAEGTRDYTFHPVETPKDWENLAELDPHRGALGDQIGVANQEHITLLQAILDGDKEQAVKALRRRIERVASAIL